MSEKIEQIKKLQQDLFIEEHGVTKEQARKLNEFIHWEPIGKEFDFWAGREIEKASTGTMIVRLQDQLDKQNKRISDQEWEHKKLWMNTLFFNAVLIVAGISWAIVYFKG